MATPVYVASGTVASSTGTLTPSLPVGWQPNDIFLLFIETANQVVTVPSGWAQVTGSPQGIGSAGSNTSTRLTVLWRRATTTETAPTLADPGDHILAFIAAYRGCRVSGNPWNITSTVADSAINTTLTIPGATTTAADCLIVIAAALHLDNNSNSFVSWTNSGLTNIIERGDIGTTSGNDGSLGLAEGTRAVAGTYPSTSVSLSQATAKGAMTIALLPVQSYILTADPGSALLTGTSTNVKAAYRVVAAPGSTFSTGTGVAVRAIRVASVSPGAMASAGLSAMLKTSRKLSVAPGSTVMTGTSVLVRATRYLGVSAGQYASSGTAAIFQVHRRLIISPGSASLTGSSTRLYPTHHFIVDPGAFSWTGSHVDFAVAKGAQLVRIVNQVPRPHARLYGVLALADHDVFELPGPNPGLFIPLAHPDPDQVIGINTVVCRIHILTSPIPGLYATVLFLLRASDFSPIGGAATDVIDPTTRTVDTISLLSDREFHWVPNFYALEPGDSMYAVYRTFWSGDRGAPPPIPMSNQIPYFHAKLDLLYNYVKLDLNGDPI